MTGRYGLAALYVLGAFLTIVVFAAGAALAGRPRPPRWYLLACGLAWFPLLAWRLLELLVDLAAVLGMRLGWAMLAPTVPAPVPDPSPSSSSHRSLPPGPDPDLRPRGVPTSSTISTSAVSPAPLSPDSILAPGCPTPTNES